MTEGFVYFISARGRGPIKIGWSAHPRSRLCDLQVGSPVPLRILGVIRTQRSDEASIHRLFAASRLHGEWFARSPALNAFIRAHARPVSDWPAPDPADGFVVEIEGAASDAPLTPGERGLARFLVRQALASWCEEQSDEGRAA